MYSIVCSNCVLLCMVRLCITEVTQSDYVLQSMVRLCIGLHVQIVFYCAWSDYVLQCLVKLFIVWYRFVAMHAGLCQIGSSAGVFSLVHIRLCNKDCIKPPGSSINHCWLLRQLQETQFWPLCHMDWMSFFNLNTLNLVGLPSSNLPPCNKKFSLSCWQQNVTLFSW